jgi:hypothetical protein
MYLKLEVEALTRLMWLSVLSIMTRATLNGTEKYPIFSCTS